jgi:polysaccharide pyruvyl transferase WcaK-like protein
VRRISAAEIVVGTRYHNVLVSLACGKPTVAIAYGGKHAALMGEFGQGDYCHDIRVIDGALLRGQIVEISGHLDEVRTLVDERARHQRELVGTQFDDLDAEILGGAKLQGSVA